MTCGGCNKSSNFVFMTGIPENAPMSYVDAFGPDALEVIYNRHMCQRYQSY